MNKYEFKRALKNAVDARLIMDENDAEALEVEKYIRESFGDVDPRRFKSWMEKNYKDGEGADAAFRLYRNFYPKEVVAEGVGSAKDLYPHEMAGQNEEGFYSFGSPTFWAGTDMMFVDGEKDEDRGLGGIVARYGLESPSEYLELLRDEQTRRDRKRAMNPSDPMNFDPDESRIGRTIRNFGLNTFWKNTMEDNAIGRDYAKVGDIVDVGKYGDLGLFDIGRNVADAGAALVRGPVGVAADVVIPSVTEAIDSDKNYREYDPFAVANEAKWRIGGRIAGEAGGKILDVVGGAIEAAFPKVVEKLSRASSAGRKAENLAEDIAKNEKAMKDVANTKFYEPSEMNRTLGNTQIDPDVKPSTAHRIKAAGEGTRPENITKDYDIFNDGGELVAVPKNRYAGVEEFVDINADPKWYKPTVYRDKAYATRKAGSGTVEDYERLKADNPAFREFMEGHGPDGLFNVVPVIDYGVSVASKPAATIAGRGEPVKLDVKNIENTNSDFDKVKKSYIEIAKKKPEAVKKWNNESELDDYEKSIVDKYNTMKLLFGE